VSARFIICEKSGQWVMALRWAAANLPLRIYETRSVSECREELQQHPGSFLVLEATTENLESVVQFLAELRHLDSRVLAVVVADRRLHRWEDLLREAGAVHVAYSPRRLDCIARMAYRHLPAIVPPDETLLDSVRSRMPWGLD
jgi:hypothetical protein